MKVHFGSMPCWDLSCPCHCKISPERCLELAAIIEESVAIGKGRRVRYLMDMLERPLRTELIGSIIKVAINKKDVSTIKYCLRTCPERLWWEMTRRLEDLITGVIDNPEILDLYLSYHNKYDPYLVVSYAIEAKRWDVIIKLSKFGVKIENKEASGLIYPVFQRSNGKEREQCLSALSRLGVAFQDVFHDFHSAVSPAIRNNDYATVQEMLNSEIDICLQDVNWALLHSPPSPILELLFRHLRETNRPISEKPKIIWDVISQRYPNACEKIQMLLREGVSIDYYPESRAQTIEMAMMTYQNDVVALLLDANTNIEVAMRNRAPLTFTAVMSGNEEGLKLLLNKRQIEINQIHKGDTALTLAIQRGATAIVRTLIEHGAKLYPQETPLQCVWEDQEDFVWIRRYIIPDLARETVENRFVNKRDIDVLKRSYPNSHKEYLRACREWERMKATPIFPEVSYAQVVEQPAKMLLNRTRPPAPFRHLEGYRLEKRFPIYNKVISRPLSKLLKIRRDWIKNKRKLYGIGGGRIPEVIAEMIANYMIEDQ